MSEKKGSPALAGALSGACQVIAEHPLDLIKIRMQSRLAAFVHIPGPLAMLRHTVSSEGAAALFQGLSPRLATYSAVKLSLFSLYESWKPHCNGSPALAGGLAGACNTVVSCPQDVLKSRLQVLQLTQSARSGALLSVARAMLRQSGPLAFYRGWQVLLLRDCLGYCALFSVFHGTALQQQPSWLRGGCAGVAFYMLTLPLDRAKTIVMTDHLRSPSPWLALRDVLHNEGGFGLYRGCAATLLRTFIGQAVGLSVYSRIATMPNLT